MAGVSKDSVVVACLQLNSHQSVTDNLQTVLQLVEMAADQDGVQLIVLPENAFCHPYDKNQQEDLNRVLPALQNLAKKKQIWIFAGTIPVPAADGSGKVYSALQVINDQGEVVAVYRKLHLFDVHVADEGVDYRESNTFVAGNEVLVVSTPWGNIGLAICYDLRFPEFFLAMEGQRPMALVVPSAFTLHTGKKHWHILVKARAIDNFAWLLAANQVGVHPGGRATFGHSVIVSPDGEVVKELPEGQGYICHTIDGRIPAKLQSQIPLLQHRRFRIQPKPV